MLRRLFFSLSTSKIYSTCVVLAKPTEPKPIALALELSPKVTEPRPYLVTLLKSFSSPLMCLEQSLSRIHLQCGLSRLFCKIKERFKNPKDFKPYEFKLRDPFSLEVFRLYSYSMLKSPICIMNIMDNSKIRLTV